MLTGRIKAAAGLLGLTGVGLGAFGAHGLKSKLAANGMAQAWETAVQYHLVHTLAVLAVAAVSANAHSEPRSRWLGRAVWSWVIGVILFSGSLYAMALDAPKRLGFITPLGGIALLVGWGCVLASSRRQPETR